MIVLDANVLIAFLDESDPHHKDAVDVIERRFLEGFAATVLTVAPALVHPARTGHDADALASLASIGV